MYILLVCADLFGEKCNLELGFSSMPTIAELQRKVLEVFQMEASMRRPPGYPVANFTIVRVQIYDDALLKWVDLVSQTQMHEYDQLYVFQPQTSWHTDVQKDLPPPRPPSQSCAASAVHSMVNSPYKSAAPLRNASYRHDTPGASTNSSIVFSPTKMLLEEQRRREYALQEELNRVRGESARLERELNIEEEDNRVRGQEQKIRILRQKEEEVRRQREILMRCEEEFRHLQSDTVQY
ncbi:calmodulin-like protein containing EF hand domain [Trypanosoma rangeli]|uniref:Calmodulin-like protein containing EF hand domain n=1 Tax=Trypanosoma rangeli TaxID=5698 RepID=A0A422N0I0_TRYRA|nr:calmodulin-like protein containing EF hand domain [Trypanosoma rangeli]RNE98967.1 calmodulin-like protein containing EF hand domain [Trypanosoma rangeli]|eukprot:RNE98967.1 calmodulin-like protein containing EF hand domain [Trypanosoma rangeli]